MKTLVELVTKIGTVLAISVYSDTRGPRFRQWRCWFDDKTLRFMKSGWIMTAKPPVGVGYSMDEAMQNLVDLLGGGEIIRAGRELTDEDKSWRVPKRLTI